MANPKRDQPHDARQSATLPSRGTGVQELEGLEPVAVEPATILQRALSAPPAPLNPGDVLSLQRAAGNGAVTRLLAQRQRANRPLQRQEEEEELQLKPADQGQRAAAAALPDVNTGIEDRINAARGRGERLPAQVRDPMERRLGADLHDVRIHTDAEADRLSRSIEARAFTTGQDVFFQRNEYKPDSASGQKLIAHEVTHVLQQNGPKLARAAQRSRTSAPVRPRPSLAGRIQRDPEKTGKKKRPTNIALDPNFASLFQEKIEEHHPIGLEILAGIQEDLRSEGYEPEDPVELLQAPDKGSPYQALQEKIDDLILTGGGPATPVSAVTDVKGASKKIKDDLEAFHAQKGDSKQSAHVKWAVAGSLRDEITKWKKRNALAFWKGNTRQALTTLDGQLAVEVERLWALRQAYYVLQDLCREAKTIDEKPLPDRPSTEDALKDIEAKIKAFRNDILAKLPAEEKRTELAWALAEKVRISLSALERDARRLRKAMVEGPELEEKKAQFEGQEGKVQQAFEAEGYVGQVGQESLSDFGHQLEALDPQHRDYDQLIALFNKWLQERDQVSLDDFWTWVNRYEQLSGITLKRTRYIKDEDERRKYKLGFTGVQPYYSERTAYYSERGDEKEREEDKKLEHGIYVMTPDRQFYARRELGPGNRTASFHHSSFLAGLPVGAAGKMRMVSAGLQIDLDSGHYQPKTRHMLNAVLGLKSKGVPLDTVKVQPFFFEQKQGWRPSAQSFLDDLKLLKETEGKEGGNTGMMASRLGKEKELEEAYQAYSG